MTTEIRWKRNWISLLLLLLLLLIAGHQNSAFVGCVDAGVRALR